MLTVADIEGRELTPLSELLAAADVPGDLVDLDGDLAALLDRALFTDATFQPVENGYLGGIVLVLDGRGRPRARSATRSRWSWPRPAASPSARPSSASRPGPAGSPSASACSTWPSSCASTGRSCGRSCRAPRSPIRGDRARRRARERHAAARDRAAGRARVRRGPALPRCMIGETGVIVAAGSVRWLTPGSEDLPAGTPADFTGLHLDDVVVELGALGLADDARSRSTTRSSAAAASPRRSRSRGSTWADRWPGSTSRCARSAWSSSRTR